MADFQVVNRKRKKGKKCTAPVPSDPNPDVEVDVDPVNLSRKVELARNAFSNSPFYTDIKEILLRISSRSQSYSSCKSGDTDMGKYSETVCYGLGHLAECVIARYQLGLLLALREEKMFEECVIHCYDPKFWDVEKEMLRTLALNVLEKNEEGKRAVTSRTLFFMPHCSKSLCNNLLWANWSPGQLSKITVICNSFKNTCSSLPDRILDKSCGFIKKILPYTVEYPLPENFQYNDVFNDTSVHVFPPEKLLCVSEEMWKSCEEPVYDSEDCEFITSCS